MKKDKTDFTILDHTADLGILVRGKDIKDLFKNACHAMTEIMIKTTPVDKIKSKRLAITGQDLNELMINWLGEVLYLFYGEKEIVYDVIIKTVSQSQLDATIKVIPYRPELHEILCEIKAVTYHQIDVSEKNGYWEARVIFDL
jgi:SHS2 domain-containing protein